MILTFDFVYHLNRFFPTYARMAVISATSERSILNSTSSYGFTAIRFFRTSISERD